MQTKHNHLLIAILGFAILLAGVTVFTHLTQTPLSTITSQSQTAAVADFSSSLVAHYTFDDTTNDSAGSNHGSAVGGPTYVAGKIGMAIEFNNDGAFSSPMHVVSSSVSLSSDWSVSFWVLRISNVGAAQYAVSMTDATGIFVKDSSGINNWGFFDGATVLNGSAQIPLQNWTFITVTKSETTYSLYINGAFDASGTLDDVDISRIMMGVRSDNFLGMHGTLDDVRIYNRALNAEEVSQLYALGSGGTTLTPDPTPTLTPQPAPIPDPVVVTPPLVQQQAPPVTSGSQTYYIDYSLGNNANNGTSKTTPWKVHPFMKGFTGSYSHKAGDRFIFKGGVTWPHSAFQMSITAGGSSDSVRDYYGTDKTWYAGSSWTRPVFDFENTLISGGGFNSVGLLINSANYVTIDEIEFARYRTPAVGAGDWASGTINLNGTASNITIQNCIVRDWSNGGGADGGSGGGIWSFSSGSGNKVLHCIFHGSNTNVKSGRALSFYGEIGFNEAYDLSTFLMGGGDVHDNYVHNMKGATDPNNHENAFYIMGVSKVYNNLLHDIDPGSSSYYLEPGFSSPSGTTVVYNNVAFNVGNDAPISIETDGQYAASQNIKIFNNTIEHGVGNCIRTVLRGSQRIGSLEVANNHCITTGPAKDFPTATVTTLTDRGTDIVQTHTQAASSGATPTNRYRTTSANSPTINAGLSLPSYFTSDKLGVARPQGTAWDIGAYEYQGSGTTPPPPVSNDPLTTINLNATQWNMMSGSDFIRGKTYILSPGVYQGKNLNTPANGNSVITIKGTGTGQVVFTGSVTFSQPNYIFDGVTGGGPGNWTTGFGFKVAVTSASSGYGLYIVGNNVIVRHVEVEGNGGDGNGTASMSNDLVIAGPITGFTLSYAYLHDAGRTIFFSNQSAQNVTIEYTYTGYHESTTGQHSEIASIWGTDPAMPRNWTFRYNIFTHSEGTGGLMMDGDGLNVYGNVFVALDGNSLGGGNGLIGTWSADRLTNMKVYNNTFINPGTNIVGILNSDDTGEFRNNVIYKGGIVIYTEDSSNIITRSNNHYVDVTGDWTGRTPEATGGTTGTGDPFVSLATRDFTLKTNTSTGVNLGAPYNIDALGRTRTTWTRGAYEYTGSGTTPLSVTPPVTPPTYKPGDFNRDGAVNALDFSLLSGAWNQNNSTYDLNTDGIVNSLDYVIMVQNWTG